MSEAAELSAAGSAGARGGADKPAEAPLLRIVRGQPTEAELAAIVAVVAARRAAGVPTDPEPLRRPLHPWVASGLVKGTRTRA